MTTWCVFTVLLLLAVGVANADLLTLLREIEAGDEVEPNTPVDAVDKVVCGHIGDLVFLVDASSSLKPEDYELSKSFIRGLINNMDLRADRIRVGLTVFNQFATVAFHLNTIVSPNMSAAGLLAMMDDLPPIARGTFTHRGIQTVREKMFTEENGDRPDVRNVVIILTDGRSNKQDETAKEAELLRQTGAIVFAVAVGRWNSDTQLQVLASKPAKDYRFSTNNFLDLDTLKTKLTERICNVFEIPPEVVPECNGKADVLFIMDASSSISADSFEKGKAFVTQLVQRFIVSQEFVRVAAITFHFFSDVAFHLNTHDTIDGVVNGLMDLTKKGSGTRTDRALESAREEIFNLIRGDRPGVPNIIILITDGNSRRPDLTLTQAELAKQFGATIITIGVGKQKIEELESVASLDGKSQKKLTFAVSDFEELHNITNKLVKDTCDVPQQEVAVVDCDTKMDVVFVLDLSKRMEDSLVELKMLVKMVGESYTVGSDRVRIGIISFNSKADLTLKLSEGIDMETIVSRLETLETKYKRKTDKALDLLRTEAFTAENGGRPDAVKIAIIVSVGNSRRLLKTTSAANMVHNDGITTFAMTVGRMKESEVNALASEPTSTYRYSVDTFEALFSFILKLKERSCAI